MAEFVVKVHPKLQLAYIRDELFRVLGTEPRAVSSRRGVFLYPKGADLKEVLRSLEIIRQDLEIELGESGGRRR